MSGIAIPRIERSKAENLNLSSHDRVAMLQTVQTPGFAVILRLMEIACILQDAKLVAVEPGQEKTILAEHSITVAKWEFFDEIQKQIQREADLAVAPPADLRTDAQKEADRVLNP